MKKSTTKSWLAAVCIAFACKASPDAADTSASKTGPPTATSTQAPPGEPTPNASSSVSGPVALSRTADALATAAESAAQSKKATRKPDVIYVPTPQPIVDKMLELANVQSGDLVYDLGCGDGRIVVTAAKRYGVRAVGFDIDPKRVAEAKDNVRKNGVEDLVSIEQKDIFTLDLRPANVVTLYLLPQLNVKLIPQLERMRPGSRIVSHDFDIAGVAPLQELTLRPKGDETAHSIFLFQVPLKKER
jgi:SAM-dependent methyltransferase